MVAVVGFAMIICIVALLLKGKMSPIVVLTVIPAVAALILGHGPVEIADFIKEGVKTTTNNGQTEQTTESITAQGKKDATEKVKRTEKSSEQTLDTTANTSFKEVTHSPKKENIRVDSIILFVMIVALVAALILLKILLGKRKK